MKKTCYSLLCAASLLSLPLPGLAADVTADSATIFRFESRDLNGAKKETLLPATQFLGLDAEKLADGNLSLHLYGWGRADLADKSYSSSATDGSITYGYLQYRFTEAGADLRAGRFFVREGIVNEQVDGVSARTGLPYGFVLSAFGGAPVHTRHLFGETSDGKGDSIFGGRAGYRYKGMFEVGLSGVYEGTAPTLTAYSNGSHRLVGGDVWYRPHRIVEIAGHTSYNPETDGIAEHSYLLTLKPAARLTVSGEFNEQHQRSYLYAWSMFSGAALNPSDRSRSVGGSASYAINATLELAADYKHYSREFGTADRYGADARVTYLNGSVRGGIGYHYLRADEGFAISANPSGSYQELRAYALHDTKGYFAAVDALGYFFKEKIYNESSAWETQVSLGYHLTPALALSGDLSYGRNPQFTEEVKGLLRLTYNMTLSGTGGKK